MVNPRHGLRTSLTAALLTAVPLLTAMAIGGDSAAAAEAGDADLRLSLSASLGSAYAGQPFGFSYSVFNAGPVEATGVVVTLVFPAGLSPANDPATCTPVPAGVACSFNSGPIPADRSVSGPMYLVASAAGSYTISGRVTADQPDPMPGDNTVAAEVTVAPGADLTVGIAESADPVRPNASLTYTVTVTNRGPSTATAVRLTEAWSGTTGEITVRAVAIDGGTCTPAASGVDCALGDLASGAAAIVTVTLRPKRTGTVTDQAQVSAAEHEVDPSTNTTTETTVVSR